MSNAENSLLKKQKSYKEGLLLVQQCGFCLIPEIKTTEYFQNMYGDLPHTLNVPGVPANFTVLQDLVPIAEQGGHLLVMPNAHYISLATVEDQEGIAVARDAIIGGLRKHFPNNSIFTFEHGQGFLDGEPVACGGCHLDHAHGHLIILPEGSQLAPIQNKVEEVLLTNGWMDPNFHAVRSGKIFIDITQRSGTNPYLHIGMVMPDGASSSLTYVQKTKSLNVPSQLLRASISEVIYKQTDPTYWHWRDVQMGLASSQRMEQMKRDVVAFRQITGF
ncbi:MAG: hypothetical protein UR15_C0016G0002 [Parcubacteria group bacterium GW2011_GWA2_31_28]|nr:MAG: hypothetical protein UR15_C0016G0002 [Parcubacteria group bacterium GW2011_GWA2_31_28]